MMIIIPSEKDLQSLVGKKGPGMGGKCQYCSGRCLSCGKSATLRKKQKN